MFCPRCGKEYAAHVNFCCQCGQAMYTPPRVEKKLIQRYLSDADGNVSKAAQLANIPRRTFYRLLDKHGLKGRSDKP